MLTVPLMLEVLFSSTRMKELFHALITKCELSVRRDGISARGPLALFTLVILSGMYLLAK
jgi:hypothetical protein